MADTVYCPQCGAELVGDIPSGLCPACLLEQGFGSQPGRSPEPDLANAGSDAEAAEAPPEYPRASAPTAPFTPRGRFVPPLPAELARHFPQLEILELLGHGGMGAVYKARQRQLNRLVALKILPPEVAQDPAFAERFTREAQSLAQLNHPHIVTVHDFGQAGPFFYFIMEFVDGANLRHLIADHKLGQREALAIVPQVCEALQYAHDEGIVHRDIKPENLLIDKKGRVKIADFGLAKLLNRGEGGAPGSPRPFTLTGSQQVMGTPHYMAPEQTEQPLAVDHRADIYSLGVVFYEMLTGELPLGRFAAPSQKVQMDVRLDEVVLRSLEKERELRYQQASEVKTDVERISRSPQPQPPVGAQPPLPDAAESATASEAELEAARRRVMAPAIALIVAAVLACSPVLSALLWYRWEASPNERSAGRSAAIEQSPARSPALEPSPARSPAIEPSTTTAVLIPLAIVLGLLAIPVATIVGAAKMLRLRSRGWAITAAVLALSPIPSGPCWLIGLPIGIWALVVLSRPDVRAAFQAQARLRAALTESRTTAGSASVRRSFAGWIIAAIALLPLLVVLFIWVRYMSPGRPTDATRSDTKWITQQRPEEWYGRKAAGDEHVEFYGPNSPIVSDRLAQHLGLDASQRAAMNRAFQNFSREFRALEDRNTAPKVIDEKGHQITTIPAFREQLTQLEDRFWSELESALDGRQLTLGRKTLRLREGMFMSGQFGYRVEIWRVGQINPWYHWKVSHPGISRSSGDPTSSAPQLPANLRRFWTDRTRTKPESKAPGISFP